MASKVDISLANQNKGGKCIFNPYKIISCLAYKKDHFTEAVCHLATRMGNNVDL